jgi:hypothetical protein
VLSWRPPPALRPPTLGRQVQLPLRCSQTRRQALHSRQAGTMCTRALTMVCTFQQSPLLSPLLCIQPSLLTQVRPCRTAIPQKTSALCATFCYIHANAVHMFTEPVEEEQKPWSPDAELPLEGDAMTLHLMDAHEEAGQPGTVYLFGKVWWR